MAYGPHLFFEGYLAPGLKILKDLDALLDLLYRVVDEFPGKIGMTKIRTPHIQMERDGKGRVNRLISYIFIAESHIAIHLWPEKEKLFLDVFSCKPFDHMAAIEYLREYFPMKKGHYLLMERGEDYEEIKPALKDTIRFCEEAAQSGETRELMLTST